MQTIGNCTVKYAAGRVFKSKFDGGADRQNVVLTDKEGKEHTVWFDVGQHPWASLERGQNLVLGVSPRGDYVPMNVDVDHEPPRQQKETQKPKTDTALGEIDTYASVFVECLAAIELHISRHEGVRHDYDADAVQRMASTIFIQLNR